MVLGKNRKQLSFKGKNKTLPIFAVFLGCSVFLASQWGLAQEKESESTVKNKADRKCEGIDCEVLNRAFEDLYGYIGVKENDDSKRKLIAGKKEIFLLPRVITQPYQESFGINLKIIGDSLSQRPLSDRSIEVGALKGGFSPHTAADRYSAYKKGLELRIKELEKQGEDPTRLAVDPHYESAFELNDDLYGHNEDVTVKIYRLEAEQIVLHDETYAIDESLKDNPSLLKEAVDDAVKKATDRKIHGRTWDEAVKSEIAHLSRGEAKYIVERKNWISFNWEVPNSAVLEGCILKTIEAAQGLESNKVMKATLKQHGVGKVLTVVHDFSNLQGEALDIQKAAVDMIRKTPYGDNLFSKNDEELYMGKASILKLGVVLKPDGTCQALTTEEIIQALTDPAQNEAFSESYSRMEARGRATESITEALGSFEREPEEAVVNSATDPTH